MAAHGGHSRRTWRLSGHKKPHLDVVRNDINVTPLVDVMLVLLIIFMLMTLIMGRGHDVKLPQASNYSQVPDQQQPVVSIDTDSNLWVEKDKVGAISPANLKEVDKRVQALWLKKTSGSGRVYVKADGALTYGTVYPVLEEIARGELGVTSIDLAIAKAEAK